MDLGAPDAEPVPGLERDFPGEDNGSGAKAGYAAWLALNDGIEYGAHRVDNAQPEGR